MDTYLRQQRTIARAVRIEGYGYWSGQDTSVTFLPAPPDTGHVFIRRDLTPARRIQACLANRIEMPRRTTLSQNGAHVEMVEHILAALAGLGIHNCEMVVSHPEMPAHDGSCQTIVQALAAAGWVTQEAVRERIRVTAPIRVAEGEAWIEARPATSPSLVVEYHLAYGPGPIGEQCHTIRMDPEIFAREVAPARTFVLQAEADAMRAKGLCQRVTYQDLLVFGPRGVIDNQLRFPNECARHKILDVIGDLALVPYDLDAHIVAHRSGHRLNAAFAAAVMQHHRACRSSKSAA